MYISYGDEGFLDMVISLLHRFGLLSLMMGGLFLSLSMLSHLSSSLIYVERNVTSANITAVIAPIQEALNEAFNPVISLMLLAFSFHGLAFSLELGREQYREMKKRRRVKRVRERMLKYYEEYLRRLEESLEVEESDAGIPSNVRIELPEITLDIQENDEKRVNANG